MRIFLAALVTALLAMFVQISTAHAHSLDVPSCQVASEGIYNGFWMKHRIVIDEDVVFGANDLASILSQLESLRENNLCR